jgi:hypothetical protein
MNETKAFPDDVALRNLLSLTFEQFSGMSNSTIQQQVIRDLECAPLRVIMEFRRIVDESTITKTRKQYV